MGFAAAQCLADDGARVALVGRNQEVLDTAAQALSDRGSPDAVGLVEANRDGNVQGIAALLFSNYVFAFEATSALLITAAVGAMLLAHIHKPKSEKLGQVETMRLRFRPGNYPAPKPGPGVYATSDSVATPGRLPDGTLSQRSIPEILPTRELSSSETAPKGTEK